MTTQPEAGSRQDRLYAEAAAAFGAALERLARGYESDADRRRDLLQAPLEIAQREALAPVNRDRDVGQRAFTERERLGGELLCLRQPARRKRERAAKKNALWDQKRAAENAEAAKPKAPPQAKADVRPSPPGRGKTVVVEVRRQPSWKHGFGPKRRVIEV